MHGKGFDELLDMAVSGIDDTQPGMKGDAPALGQHQLRHRISTVPRLAENAPVADTHLIRTDDQPDHADVLWRSPWHGAKCQRTRVSAVSQVEGLVHLG